MSFRDVEGDLPANRTAIDFANRVDKDHYKKKNCDTVSCLVDIIGFDVITGFPFDYMHLLCLGITKRLIEYWVTGLPKTAKNKGKKKIRISKSNIQKVNVLLSKIKTFTPEEFQRKSRNISEYAFWKASEFRQFLLYTGPIVLKKVSSKEKYKNFLILHKLAYLLLTPFENVETLKLEADQLIEEFLRTFCDLYGYKLLAEVQH